MMKKLKQKEAVPLPIAAPERGVRADAQRNLDTLLRSAMELFATEGVDVPVRTIAEKAGVGIGTLYRHFPQRADLIAAVFQREISALADHAISLADSAEPGDALVEWVGRYASLVATKHGLAPALHSDSPSMEKLRAHFWERVRPALRPLLDAAIAAKQVRADVGVDDLLEAVASLCMPAHDGRAGYSQRMISVLVDGLRAGANVAPARSK